MERIRDCQNSEPEHYQRTERRINDKAEVLPRDS